MEFIIFELNADMLSFYFFILGILVGQVVTLFDEFLFDVELNLNSLV